MSEQIDLQPWLGFAESLRTDLLNDVDVMVERRELAAMAVASLPEEETIKASLIHNLDLLTKHAGHFANLLGEAIDQVRALDVIAKRLTGDTP